MAKYDRKKQLSELITALENLIVALKSEPHCTWMRHFENNIKEANYLFVNGFTQDDINALSSSIRSVYGGSGSFNDYYNPLDTNDIIGKYSGQAYNKALNLIVIGHY